MKQAMKYIHNDAFFLVNWYKLTQNFYSAIVMVKINETGGVLWNNRILV